MTLFTGENLASIRNGRIVFENLSFTLPAGGIMALTGPNGTGKTSLLRIMGGLLDHQDGRLSWKDETITTPPCHWLGAENPLRDKLSVWDNLSFWYDCLHAGAVQDAPHDKQQIIGDALRGMQIEPLKDISVRYLSTGQRRRANLTRLFLQERPLWLLDEPATGLDFDTKQILLSFLQTHSDQGGMAVVATHRPDIWKAGQNLDMMEYRALENQTTGQQA